MSACKHVRVSGTIRVPLSSDEALALITPTGERVWVDRWDPIFPSNVADETEPGTVFKTDHAGLQTTWIVLGRGPGAVIEYARVALGHGAGLVTASCSAAGDCLAAVTVSYDLTAFTTDDNAALEEFADHYPAFLEHWREPIDGATGD